MKDRVRLLSLLFCGVFMMGCSSQNDDAFSFAKDEVTITVVENPFVNASQDVYHVKRGDDLDIELAFSDGRAYSSCSYENASFLSLEVGRGVLRLENVYAPSRLYIETLSSEATILYHLNGGSFLSGEEGVFFYQECSFATHLRPNLAKGNDTIKREGYSLLGWNSASNGSGEHYGLGSRITIAEGATIELYAEWAKETETSAFKWERTENEAMVAGYIGNEALEELVIPSSYDGLPVTRIKRNAFTGLKASRLVLPSSISSIDSLAFRDCSFEDVYLFDSITKMADDSFSGIPVKTVHINAYLDPGYLAESDNCCFADDMDRLILSAKLPKMIFFGGCSMGYGLDCSIFKERYGDEYAYLNMGVIGGTNALFQFDCMLPYIGEGDIFVHAPEQSSPYQLMADLKAESRIFMCCEGNFDLLSLVDCSQIEGFFSKFAGYNLGKITEGKAEGGLYTDSTSRQNEYGDFSFERLNSGGNVGFSDGEYTYNPDLVSEESLANLAKQYDRVKAKGASVYFSYAPLNYSNLKDEDVSSAIWDTFADAIEAGLSEYGYQVISQVTAYLFQGHYFYDTDYHLTNEGAVIRSKRLLSDLATAMEDSL